MAPRRSHAKSRRGCDICRERRVKCDETGPPCSNCTARQIACTYRKAQQFSNKDQQAVAVPSERKITRDSVHKRELELLHRYSVSTHQSLTHIFDVPDDIWRLFAVQQAFKYDFLLNGIISLTASHAASEGATNHRDYLVTAAEYLELALSEFRSSLDTVSDDNCHAVYIFGMVLCTTLFSQLESSAAYMTWHDLLDKLNSIYECLSGVGKVIVTSLDQIRAGPLEPILARLEAKDTDCTDQGVLDALASLHELSNEYSVALKLPNQQALRCDKMIDDLKACWSHRIFVIDWLTITGKEFQADLRNGGIMETLLLAHWGVALCSIQQYWFVKDLGAIIAQRALEQIRPVNERLQQSVSWVKMQTSLSQRRTIP